MAVLRTSDKVIRAMRGAKLAEKRSSQELNNLLDLEATLDVLARASRV